MTPESEWSSTKEAFVSESTVPSVAPSSSRGNVATAAALAVALAAVLAAWGTFGDGGNGVGDYLPVLVIIAGATAVVFGWIVPRALRKESAGGAALVLSALAIVSVAAFWSGLPPVLAAGGIVIGFAGWHAPRGAGLCRAAVLLGALAIAADIAVYIQDMALS